jgi:murein DD-endopeptidase MepM/ murein hydrolase activator NlpD
MNAIHNKCALALLALVLAVPATASARPEEVQQPLPPLDTAVFPIVGGAGSFGEGAARFGASRSGHVHEGQDVFAPEGTPLVAVRDGVVLETGDDGGRGNFISFYSAATRQTYVYMHMAEPSRVGAGRRVSAGQRVGSVGCTGSCWGDHLHFEVRRGRGTQAPAIDPLPLLESLQQAH